MLLPSNHKEGKLISVKVTRIMWQAKGMSIATKMVALCLANHANQESLIALLSYETIMSECGVSHMTVKRALKDLESVGLVSIERGGKFRHDTHLYSFVDLVESFPKTGEIAPFEVSLMFSIAPNLDALTGPVEGDMEDGPSDDARRAPSTQGGRDTPMFGAVAKACGAGPEATFQLRRRLSTCAVVLEDAGFTPDDVIKARRHWYLPRAPTPEQLRDQLRSLLAI